MTAQISFDTRRWSSITGFDMGGMEPLKIDRVWAMPHKWTFTIKPIKRLLDEELAPYTNVIDPCAINIPLWSASKCTF